MVTTILTFIILIPKASMMSLRDDIFYTLGNTQGSLEQEEDISRPIMTALHLQKPSPIHTTHKLTTSPAKMPIALYLHWIQVQHLSNYLCHWRWTEVVFTPVCYLWNLRLYWLVGWLVGLVLYIGWSDPLVCLSVCMLQSHFAHLHKT